MDNNIYSVDAAKLCDSLELAVRWLTEIAMVRSEEQVNFPPRLSYKRWRGAIRGEYSAAGQQWEMFCPMWHTGQAIKALCLAAKALNKPELLDEAAFCAGFIMDNRITSSEDAGLIPAFEDIPDQINISAVLESLDGLFHLSESTGNRSYSDAAVQALKWVRDHAWVPKKGIFNDIYDPQKRQFNFETRSHQGRPLLDDAVFVTAWQLTGDRSFLDMAQRIGETLLEKENPQGNWIAYIPCNTTRQDIHPRHAYWWGMPMRKLYHATGDKRFLDCFERGAQWYARALRTDGGIIRRTRVDFNTESFGHATSGSACAARYFLQYQSETGNSIFEPLLGKALNYCMNMQFTHPQDHNLHGAILEKILPPSGSDASPYYIRDLGTIFFIQAAAEYLLRENSAEAYPLPTALTEKSNYIL